MIKLSAKFKSYLKISKPLIFLPIQLLINYPLTIGYEKTGHPLFAWSILLISLLPIMIMLSYGLYSVISLSTKLRVHNLWGFNLYVFITCTLAFGLSISSLFTVESYFGDEFTFLITEEFLIKYSCRFFALLLLASSARSFYLFKRF